MITPGWVRAMAAYNAEMNRRWYAAAETLTDAQRQEPVGAFFGSLHGTLSHLLWADHTWMSRFDGWEKPGVGIPGSASFEPDWAALVRRRVETDARISAWAARLAEPDLEGMLSWFSGAAGREMTKPRWLLVSHMFNHQTHHRGQAHALLTRFGAKTQDTDLPWAIADADLA